MLHTCSVRCGFARNDTIMYTFLPYFGVMCSNKPINYELTENFQTVSLG